MSTWGVGDHHDSEEVRTLKEQLRARGLSLLALHTCVSEQLQDASNATLHSEYLKREAELKEVRDQWNAALAKVRPFCILPHRTLLAHTCAPLKLAKDADRMVQLEAELRHRSEDLSNERVTRANAEAALASADERLKKTEHDVSALQATIDTLSHHASSSSAGRSKLEQDNTSLLTRIRALERELQNKSQAEEAALRQSQSSRHRRQPSDTVFCAASLEREVAELRSRSVQQTSDLERMSEQLTRTRGDLVRLQNEKTVSERRLRRQLEETQAVLDEREEDLRLARDARGGEDTAAREAELLERLEEEEKRVSSLENELARSSGSRKRDIAMLQEELNRTGQLLEEANERATTAELKIAEFARGREAALHEYMQLQEDRNHLSEQIEAAQARIR